MYYLTLLQLQLNYLELQLYQELTKPSDLSVDINRVETRPLHEYEPEQYVVHFVPVHITFASVLHLDVFLFIFHSEPGVDHEIILFRQVNHIFQVYQFHLADALPFEAHQILYLLFFLHRT